MGADVLHLVTNAQPEIVAGYTIRTQGIALAQRAAGLDAHVATRLGFPVTAGHVGAERRVLVDGVPHHRLLPRRPLPLHIDQRLTLDVRLTARLVDHLRPRLLHAHSKHTNAQVALAVARPRGLPVVYEVRGFLEETWRSRGHDVKVDAYVLARDAEERCIRRADAVVTLAETMRQRIVDAGASERDVVVVPNAVDPRFLAEPPDPTRLRQALGISPEDVVVGTVSTLNHYEGIGTLIEAVKLLHASGAPVHVVIAGGGPAKDSLARQVSELGLEPYVHLLGRLPFQQVRTAHAAIDIFCVPREDLPVTRLVPPLKPVEAMATGRPVVASDLAPIRETVVDGSTGRLAPAGDVQGWYEVLDSLVYDASVREQLGSNARRWVIENRTWGHAAGRYSTLYRRLGAL